MKVKNANCKLQIANRAARGEPLTYASTKINQKQIGGEVAQK